MISLLGALSLTSKCRAAIGKCEKFQNNSDDAAANVFRSRTATKHFPISVSREKKLESCSRHLVYIRIYVYFKYNKVLIHS